MKPTETTVEQVVEIGEQTAKYFTERLGYDSALFNYATISASGRVKLSFDYIDNFQQEIDQDKRYRSGVYETIDLDDLATKLAVWPMREQRELEILARRLSALGQNTADIRSAQVRAFVERLQPEIDKVNRALTDQREAAERLADDEITF